MYVWCMSRGAVITVPLGIQAAHEELHGIRFGRYTLSIQFAKVSHRTPSVAVVGGGLVLRVSPAFFIRTSRVQVSPRDRCHFVSFAMRWCTCTPTCKTDSRAGRAHKPRRRALTSKLSAPWQQSSRSPCSRFPRALLTARPFTIAHCSAGSRTHPRHNGVSTSQVLRRLLQVLRVGHHRLRRQQMRTMIVATTLTRGATTDQLYAGKTSQREATEVTKSLLVEIVASTPMDTIDPSGATGKSSGVRAVPDRGTKGWQRRRIVVDAREAR